MPHYTPDRFDEPGGWEFSESERTRAMDECFDMLGADSFADVWRDIAIEAFPCVYSDDHAEEVIEEDLDWLHGQLIMWRNASRSERPCIANTVSKILEIEEREAIEYLNTIELDCEQYIAKKMLDDELMRLTDER